jgi:hypothetical protein
MKVKLTDDLEKYISNEKQLIKSLPKTLKPDIKSSR